MKILLASPYGGLPGGISRWTEHIMNYYESLSDKGCVLKLLPMGRSRFVNVSSGKFYRLRSAIVDYRKILSSFNAMLDADRFDVMHLTSSASISLLKDLLMIGKAKSEGIRTIVHFRFGRIPELARKRNWEWKLLVRVVRKADTVIVLDKSSYDTLIEAGFRNIEILPNPVSPKVEDIVRKNEDIVRLKNTVLFAGHVVRTKGVFELVEACNSLPDVKLKMVGHVEDDMRDTLLKMAECQIDIVGEMPYDDVIREMLRCDVFALPTYTEGFPNVILESMAAGCAIVTTSVGAIPQMLEDEGDKKYGLVIPPQNVNELKKALSRMLDDESLKHECRVNAKQRVTERYSMDSVWRQLQNIWKLILSLEKL